MIEQTGERKSQLIMRGKWWFAFILIIFIGIGIYYHFRVISPIAIGEAVGTYYHDPHPKITIYSTRDDATYQPMYIIKLQGQFKESGLHADIVSLSVLANGTYLWAMTASQSHRRIANFPGVPMFWGDFVFTPS